MKRVAAHPNNYYIGTTSADRNIKIFDTSSEQTFLWRTIHTFTGHTGPSLGISFNRDGTLVVTSSHDMTGRIWDMSNDDPAEWDQLAVLKGHTEIVKACDFAPDGQS